MNKIIIFVLAIVSILLVESVAAGEAREVLRARLSVRRNKVVDAKATGVLDANADSVAAGALLESQPKLSTLTKRFKQGVQQKQQTVSVDSDSSLSLPAARVNTAEAAVEIKADAVVEIKADAVVETKAKAVVEIKAKAVEIKAKAVEIKSEDSLSAPSKSASSSLIQTEESWTLADLIADISKKTSAESAEAEKPEEESEVKEPEVKESAEDVLRQLLLQATKQLQAVKLQALKVKRESQLKYIAELVSRIDGLEALIYGKMPARQTKEEQTLEKLVAEKKARDKHEIQRILAYLRPSLEKAQAQARIHKAEAKKELIVAYRHIKKVVDAVREDIIQQLAIEIAINYPLLADALGLFNEEPVKVVNNTSVNTNNTIVDNTIVDNNGTYVDDSNSTVSSNDTSSNFDNNSNGPTRVAGTSTGPSRIQVFKKKVEDKVKQVKSFLKGEKKVSGTAVKSDVLPANDNKLRRQLSKSR